MEALSHVPQKTASENAVLEHALRRGVRTVFQPIISLETEAVLGYEALSRGPSGSELESPEELFRVAREAAGQVVELDRVCQAAAIRRALDASLPTHLALFVNAEPEAARHEVDEPHSDAFAEAGKRGLRLILEVTERALLNDPAGLLTGARRARSAGWGMALDDVGADTRALALLPVVEPDVIKLDMALIHNRPDPHTAEIVHAIAAEAERRGTNILAEGIETREQLEHARSLGATLGQGYLFGRPAPLAHEGADPGRRIPIGGAVHSGRPPTPFQVLSASRPTRTA
ncbi:MAG: EAL domain-containing protein, partial [Actinomycetota bacterium]|nr:EAL domain-containing protein [Actinomycetota bacterium]